jgi:hypothetical protein
MLDPRNLMRSGGCIKLTDRSKSSTGGAKLIVGFLNGMAGSARVYTGTAVGTRKDYHLACIIQSATQRNMAAML